MYQLFITWGQQTIDYTRYLDQTSVNIQEQINVPTQTTFNLTPISKNFIAPPQMAYVQLYSSKYDRSLFTGFISSQTTKSFMALSQIVPDFEGGHLYQYAVACTSDEYLLNCKAVPFIPAWVNQFEGQILASLANTLCPGYFDTSQMQQGDLVPFLQYSPQQSWCELAQQFANNSRFRYKVKDKIIQFAPYGDAPFGITYDEFDPKKLFSPKDLQTTVLTVPIVNDITIVGNTEAGNNHEDYFLGDGFTANDPLLHKVFRGASVVLMQDSWNANYLNTQNWYAQDPGDNFDYSAGALNVLQAVTGAQFAQGLSYISLNNGLELAGGIDLQVGEVTFNAACEGILGGIYVDSTFQASGLLAGFNVTSPNGVVVGTSGVGIIPGAPAIGVGGVLMQAIVTGSFVGASGQSVLVGPQLVSEINHDYVLLTLIHAPQYVRYTQVYRTLTGLEYGGTTNETQGAVTFVYQDYDIAAASGFFYSPAVTTYTLNNVIFPPFAQWALVNNERLNITITNSTVALMPLGGLYAMEGPSGLWWPTGLILPMLPADSGGYIGPVLPVGAPQVDANIYNPPLLLNPYPTIEMMGSGFDLQVAQVSQGNTSDTLAFYAQSTPAAGTPVRFQSWEAQAAVSRLRASGSIVSQQQIVGDDGLRTAIVTNLSPLPRTSEDCDEAAQAFLDDRTQPTYNGTYQCSSLYFNGLTSDQQFFPTVGRYMIVNAPRRGIFNQQMLVSSLTITMLEMKEEILQYQIQFGADLHLEKVLFNFVDIQPVNVLAPQDLANPPNPRYTINVDNSYLPDLNNVQVDLTSIKPGTASVDVLDPYYGTIEVRRIDSNWGMGSTPDLLAIVQGPRFLLNRPQYDGVWYLRAVQYNEDGTAITSRRSKVLRIRWPQAPSQPVISGVTPIQGVGPDGGTLSTYQVQYFWNGDQRNIYGLEVRAADNATILAQKPVASLNDLLIDLSATPLLWLEAPLNTDYNLAAYFFNQQWDYSPPTFLGREALVGAALPYLWCPAYQRVYSSDVCVTDDQFGVQVTYELQANGTYIATPILKGVPPPNQDSTVIDAPILLGAAIVSGGSFSAAATGSYLLAVSAADGNVAPFHCTDLSNQVAIDVPFTGGATIVFAGELVGWGPTYHAFWSNVNNNDGWHFAGSFNSTPGTNTITGSISSAFPSFGVGAPDSLMSEYVVTYQKVRHSGIWGGQVAGVSASSITLAGGFFPTNSLTGRYISMLGRYNTALDIPCLNLAIASNTSGASGVGSVLEFTHVGTPNLTATVMNTDNSASGPLVQVGDTLSISFLFSSTNVTTVAVLEADPVDAPAPGQNFTGINLYIAAGIPGLVPGSEVTVAGYTGASAPMNGTWMVSNIISQYGLLAGSVVYNYFVQLVANLPPTTVYSNGTATAAYLGLQSQLTDPMLINSGNTPGISGLDPNAEPGGMMVIQGGTGAGQPSLQIASVSGGIGIGGASGNITIVLGGTWNTLPDATSAVAICDPQIYSVTTPRFTTASWDVFSTSIQLPALSNLAGATWLFTVFTSDIDGNYNPSPLARWRLVYVAGAQGTRTIQTSQTMLSTDGFINCDTSQLPYQSGILGPAISPSQVQITGIYASGVYPLNGTYMNIDSEAVFIVGGAPTPYLDVTRGELGTMAVAHASGAPLQIASALIFTLLPAYQIPNVLLIVAKDSTDINYVDVRCWSVGGVFVDTYPNGNTDIILPDNSQALGVTMIKFPGAGII